MNLKVKKLFLWCLKAVKLDFFDTEVDISAQRRHGHGDIWTSVYIFVEKTVLKFLENKFDTKSLPWLQKNVNIVKNVKFDVRKVKKVKKVKYQHGHGQKQLLKAQQGAPSLRVRICIYFRDRKYVYEAKCTVCVNL